MPRDDFGEALNEAITANVYRKLRKELGGPQLPEGTVTIMFTDVEGSSELVRDLGDKRARTILRRHDEIVGQAIRSHEGTEVERAGDSFMAAFTTARRAVACALEIQRTLAADRQEQADTAVHVRIGMDTGEVLAEEQRYFGSTVFRAARIADLAPAGRILVSEATKVLASQAGFEFDDLGEHELKGLGAGHRLYEVTAGPATPE
ncbi:MAG TPA: adenylate/guanylate cyclase domain-containing protein [Actinomycetota bacterium]